MDIGNFIFFVVIVAKRSDVRIFYNEKISYIKEKMLD